MVLSTKSNFTPGQAPNPRTRESRSSRKRPLTQIRTYSKWQLQDTARRILPDSRVGSCNLTVEAHKDWIDVKTAGRRAWFSGVHQCGNVWACPICSERISRARRDELVQGLGLAIEARLGLQMVTLTTRHGAADDLQALRAKYSKALTKLKSARRYRQVLEDAGYIGEIRAFEVTHGAHGWHPHTHTIMVTERPLTPREQIRLRRRIFCLWFKACAKVGLPPPRYRGKDGKYVGVDVQGARHAAKYVSKWGFAQELTGAKFKSGRAQGRTPWQLLADATDGDREAAALWVELVLAFKGVAQLFWSRGLRKRLQLGDQLTDQQALDLEPAETKKVAQIEVDDWILICGAELRGRVLELAIDDPDSIPWRIAALRDMVRTEGIDIKARGWLKRIRWDTIRGYWL